MNLDFFQCGECGGQYDVERSWAGRRYSHKPGCPVPASELGLPPPVPGPEVLAWRRQKREERELGRVLPFPVRKTKGAD